MESKFLLQSGELDPSRRDYFDLCVSLFDHWVQFLC